MISSLADIHGAALGAEELETALATWGVTRVPVDYFHVGSFRYTNALDALSEAKRERDEPVCGLTQAISADPGAPVDGTKVMRPAEMIDADAEKLLRENTYLRQRCAQLQGDVTDLGAQILRLQTQLERLHGREPSFARPNPLSGGQ